MLGGQRVEAAGAVESGRDGGLQGGVEALAQLLRENAERADGVHGVAPVHRVGRAIHAQVKGRPERLAAEFGGVALALEYPCPTERERVEGRPRANALAGAEPVGLADERFRQHAGSGSADVRVAQVQAAATELCAAGQVAIVASVQPCFVERRAAPSRGADSAACWRLQVAVRVHQADADFDGGLGDGRTGCQHRREPRDLPQALAFSEHRVDDTRLGRAIPSTREEPT